MAPPVYARQMLVHLFAQSRVSSAGVWKEFRKSFTTELACARLPHERPAECGLDNHLQKDRSKSYFRFEFLNTPSNTRDRGPYILAAELECPSISAIHSLTTTQTTDLRCWDRRCQSILGSARQTLYKNADPIQLPGTWSVAGFSSSRKEAAASSGTTLDWVHDEMADADAESLGCAAEETGRPVSASRVAVREESSQQKSFLSGRGGADTATLKAVETNSNPPLAGSVKDAKSPETLEISQEARSIFEATWDKVVALFGEENLQVPKEIVWLNGAPGAGKGANTPFILKTRGFQAKSIQISDLLAFRPEVVSVMMAGGLVSDSLVLHMLMEAILQLGKDHAEVAAAGEEEEGQVSGAVVDGFPRTTLQVDLVKLLYDKMMDLHVKYLDTPSEASFPRPIFRIAVLYVEEEESVRRQLARGKAAIVHNQRVLDSGVGSLREVRPTDLDEKAGRRRYQIFREHYSTLLRLKEFFPFHLIDSMGTLSECREQIEMELQYQSALELEATTFRAISHIPLAADIAKLARQNMVTRLDSYEKHDHHLFADVIHLISKDLVPIIRRCALSGIAVYNTERALFFAHPGNRNGSMGEEVAGRLIPVGAPSGGTEAAEMLADILSERGYAVTWQMRTREVPVRVNRETFEIECLKRNTLQFRIKFDRPLIRSMGDKMAGADLAPLGT